ncbi:hypothetical protein [Nocardiopsis potens]|uniref:hypothetical protein n=1 Tax=Nocardiopsis potens TaxID=1246458 RepID=UPI00034CBECA|nr:hypothetical protein [Nocardiopsis potens]
MRGSDGQAPSEPAAADGAGEPDAESAGERAERASGGRAAALLERGVRDPVVMLGGALILASLVLKAYVLRQAYFIEDDFLFVADAAAHDLTVEYLTDLHKGHLMPGAKLLAYIQTAISPYNWGLTAGVMVLFQAGAAIGLFRLLWVVFGRRWAIVPPLALFLFAPLTMPVLAWWSAALNAVPYQLAIVLALLWTVRYLRGGEARHAWMAAGAVVLGMAFSVKAMFLPPLLFVFAAAFVVQGRLPRVLWRTLDRDMPFWVGMALLSVVHGLVYLSLQETAEGEGAGRPDGGTALGLAGRMLGETFPVGAVGGPGEWGPVTPAGGLLEPAAWAVGAAWGVLLAVVAASVVYRRRAWRAWALLAGHLVVVDALPTVIARGRYQETIGYDPRYVADAALVLAVVVALAFIPTLEERRADPGVRRRPLPPRTARTGAVAGTLAFTLLGAYSTWTFADTLSGDRVRWYLDTVRASVEGVPAEAGIYSRPVPEDIVLPWNGQRRLSSNVLSPLAPDGVAERIRVPRPADSALVFNDAGYLVPARPAEGSAFFGPPEDEECLVTFGGQAMWEVSSFGGPTMVLTITYTSETDTEVNAVIGDAWRSAVLPAAPDGGSWYLPLDGAGTRLALSTSEEDLCMNWVTFGELVPATEGDPWSEENAEDAEGGGDAEDSEDGGKKDGKGEKDEED